MPRTISSSLRFYAALLVIGGCAPCDRVGRDTEAGLALMEDAVASLGQQSEAWQNTLGTLEQDLVKAGESALANEVNDLIGRGIAKAGVELRCNLDFIGKRMKQALQRIIARLKGKTVTPPTPTFCQVVPTSINMGLDSDRRSTIEFYGYDLDVSNQNSVNVVVIQKNGDIRKVQNTAIALVTHYLMTINLSSNGAPLDSNSAKIAIRAGKTVLSNVLITQPSAPPPCGANGQACCTSGPSACDSSSLTCQSGTCRVPPCSAHNQPACPDGSCDSGLANIENVCKHVTVTENAHDSCGQEELRVKGLNGTVSINKGVTKSFYVPGGGDIRWDCGTDTTNDRTGCPGDTNYVTIHRASSGGGFDTSCKRIY